MKSLLLALLTYWFTAPAHAQTGVPFKGANTVRLVTTDSAGVAFTRLTRAFLDKGYSLDKADKELRFLTTKARPAPKSALLYAFTATVRAVPGGAVLSISGTYSLPVFNQEAGTQSTITYRGMKGSPALLSWQAMEQALRAAYPDAAPVFVKN